MTPPSPAESPAESFAESPAQSLVIFGAGYTGTALARAAGCPVTLVSRDPAAAAAPGLRVVAFDDAAAAIATATHLVATAAPAAVPPGAAPHAAAPHAAAPHVAAHGGPAGDPVLARHAAAIASARSLRWVAYLSTTGVYGDAGGAWVDEATPPAPTSDRAARRVVAEAAWRDAIPAACALDIVRLAGIYGPGRSAIDDLRTGQARRVSKPGHVFGRIHRDDIVGMLLAAMQQTLPPGPRILNGADDEPAANADVVAEAARLLGIDPPPLIPFAQAEPAMSDMGRSFWKDDRKVSSRITQAALGRPWRYPSYREGLRAILAEQTA